ncbi:MAG TPA: MFS transporter, partial [Microbacterium sp.]|nr:MFS transporter [Microbacterium sp.]
MSDAQPAAVWPVFPISLAALTAFFLPLAVLPAQARAEGAPPSLAALTSTAFLLGVVAGELGAAAALRRLGCRLAILAGLFAMSLCTALLAAGATPPVWAALGAVRGIGFALVAVAAAAVVAGGARPGRRGGALGWFGLVAGVPAVVALPLGVLLTAHAGPEAGTLVAAGAAACGIPFAFLVPAGGFRNAAPGGLRAVLRQAPALRQAAALALGATASGALIAYAPASVAPSDPALAGTLLLTASVSATVARLPAGWLGDRVGPARLLGPALVVAAVGVALCAGVGWVAPALGAIGIGAGFGVLQTATLHGMSADVPAELAGAVSAVWNLAYDVGLLAGTLVFAVLAALAPSAAVLPGIAAGLAAASVLLIRALRRSEAIAAT